MLADVLVAPSPCVVSRLTPVKVDCVANWLICVRSEFTRFCSVVRSSPVWPELVTVCCRLDSTPVTWLTALLAVVTICAPKFSESDTADKPAMLELMVLEIA